MKSYIQDSPALSRAYKCSDKKGLSMKKLLNTRFNFLVLLGWRIKKSSLVGFSYEGIITGTVTKMTKKGEMTVNPKTNGFFRACVSYFIFYKSKISFRIQSPFMTQRYIYHYAVNIQEDANFLIVQSSFR